MADVKAPAPAVEPSVQGGVRAQVEDAIRGKLCVRGRYQTPLGNPSAEYPVEIQGQNVVLRDADCGLAKPTRTITLDEWATLAQGGLWRLVGIWNFVRADHEAADEIAYCYRSPYAAGISLHQARAALRSEPADTDRPLVDGCQLANRVDLDRSVWPMPTREFCGICGHESPVSFWVPDEIWEAAVHHHFRNSVLCLMCFIERADAKLVRWDDTIKLYPISLRGHLEFCGLIAEGHHQ